MATAVRAAPISAGRLLPGSRWAPLPVPRARLVPLVPLASSRQFVGAGASALGWGASAASVSEASGRWRPEHLLEGAGRLLRASSEPSRSEAATEDAPSFRLRLGASTIPNSGLGVFVDSGFCEDSACGRIWRSSPPNSTVSDQDGAEGIPEGTVVALYSGVYFPLVPLHARAAARGDGVVTDVLRLSRLWGYGAVEESLVDVSYEEASSYWLILEVFSGVMDGFRADQRVGCKSPFAVGQLINHPRRGVRPNVDWQEFRWPDAAGPGVANRLHRGLWYMDPATGEAVDMPGQASELRVPLPGIAIVATRTLRPGEELFMNYRFNPPYPPWYSPVDAD